MTVEKNHPIDELLFFIADDVDSRAADAMRELVARLAKSGPWTIGPPEFVDAQEEDEEEEPEDEPLRTVGGVLKIYSARGNLAAKLPLEVDRQHLEEVRTVIDALRSFSAVTGHELELELSGVHVGTIANGKPDRLIEEGLLAEWEKALQSKAR